MNGRHAKMEKAAIEHSKVDIQMQMLSFILIKCKMHIHLLVAKRNGKLEN